MGVKAELVCFVVLAILVSEISSKPQPICPPEEEIAPCSCKNVAYGLHVVCTNLKSSAKLKIAFNYLAPLRVGNLLLHGLYLEDPVPDTLFEGMAISALQVEDSKIKFGGKAFMGLDKSLERLTVSKCTDTGPLEKFRLARLGKLDNLIFNHNSMETIEASWLQDSIPNVRIVNFDHNEIASVKGDVFASMSQLQEISISDNRLKSIYRSMLPRPANHLTRMDFSANVLKTLPSDIFQDMPSLQTVVFSGNELQVLPQKTWSVIWDQVESVILFDNALVCDSHIDWIKEKRKPRVLKGSCAAPQNMVGRQLKDALLI